MLRVDPHGIPCIVQSIEYNYAMYHFKITWFDTKENLYIDADCVHLGLLETPCQAHFNDMETVALEFFTKRWATGRSSVS